MREIHILDNNLINKIAAGEVVERPASVVKELVENSIDAKATSVTIEIEGGGIDFIKISDNGGGIPKEQVETAFTRHATSKITSFDDLFDIMTLGFRGEALPSIASVSHMEIITKTKEQQTGIKMEISGGKTLNRLEIGATDGTIITVKNLFYNTPARRKFLKKPSAESGYISDAINRIALGHPDISIRYINNKSTVTHTSGNGDIKDCAFHIYGREISNSTIYISLEKNGYGLSGLIGMPEISRANRVYESFFINGRFIKSKIVSDAVEDAYRGRIMGGRFPVFMLNMTVPSNTVDVNVHPTKLEARFSDEDFIYEFIYDAVYNGLKDKILIPGIKLKEENSDNEIAEALLEMEDTTTKNKADKEYKVMTDDVQNKFSFPENRAEIAEKLKSELLVIEDTTAEEINLFDDENDFLIDYTSVNQGGVVAVGEENFTDGADMGKIKKDVTNDKKDFTREIENVTLESTEKEKSKDDNRNLFFKNYKIIGQIFKTYWIVEQGDEIYMIDQHAAHERVMYDEFVEKLRNRKVLSQKLIQPVAVDLSETETHIFNENRKLIEDFGFEIEEFGKNTYAVRSVPYIFKNPENVNFFKDIIDMLGDKTSGNIYDTKTDLVAAMACKAAVKGNNKLDYSEAKALIEKIISLDNPFNCPHGRPTIVKMTKYDIEKFFKRVL